MKVILLSDVDRVGARGTVVTVKTGYFRNYLYPRKLALEATPAQMKQLDKIKSQIETKQAKITKKLTDVASRLGLVSIKTSIKMGPEGAFGSITHSDIAELLAKEGHEVEKHAIVLAEPIKAPGVYDIGIKLGHQVTATVKLWVAEG